MIKRPVKLDVHFCKSSLLVMNFSKKGGRTMFEKGLFCIVQTFFKHFPKIKGGPTSNN